MSRGGKRSRTLKMEEPLVPPIPHYRQLDFYDPDMHDPNVLIVGAGGIGSPLVMMLTKLGVRRITLMDHDKVSAHNFSTTTFSKDDVGKSKVAAVGRLVAYFGYKIKLRRLAVKFDTTTAKSLEIAQKPKGEKFDVVFSAVDSGQVRKDLFRWAVKNKIPLFIDGRIGGETYRVYTVDTKNPEMRKKYLRSLTAAIKNPAPLPCTGQQVIDVGWTTAAAMTRALRQWFVEARYVPELMVKVDKLNDILHVRSGMIYGSMKERKLRKGEQPPLWKIFEQLAHESERDRQNGATESPPNPAPRS